MEYRVKMTKVQVEWADWAIDPMEDYWDEQEAEGEAVPRNLPRVEGDVLVIPDDPMQKAVIQDLLERLIDQAGDMCYSDANPGGARSSGNLAEKIMAAAGVRYEGIQ
jgi:hypothetical protein